MILYLFLMACYGYRGSGVSLATWEGIPLGELGALNFPQYRNESCMLVAMRAQGKRRKDTTEFVGQCDNEHMRGPGAGSQANCRRLLL